MGSEAAFREYDFASDDRWNRYRAGIEIPPGRDEEAILQKYRLKWYQREVDSTFQSAEPGTAPPSSAPPKTYSSEPAQSQSQQTPRAAATGSGRSETNDSQPRANAGANTARAANAAAGLKDKAFSFLKRSFSQTPQTTQTVLFSMHFTLILLAVLHLQPLNRKLSRLGWVYFFQTSLIAHGYKIYLKYGFPQLRRAGFLGILQSWLQRVGSTTEFQYLMLSATFLPQQSVTLVIVPITVLAVYHASAYCAKNFPNNRLWKQYGVRVHAFLASHQREALFYNACAEIGTGFLLVVMLASSARRAILLTFLYWNWLRMRYFSPDSATYHSQVWSIIDQKAGPYVRRVSFLQTALGFAQRWFLSLGRS